MLVLSSLPFQCSWRRRQGSMAFRCSALCTVKCSSRIFNYVSNTNDPDLIANIELFELWNSSILPSGMLN
ncbi:hypothetical protein NC653_004768 [Populus alba x Populus x berolinensis]|uniref:Uncharacterized protein n=1 Tax=Populus alba x Populus x berolinensis TaxID=444605 RepID=A0AAD6RY47_9ROSI|nr:hypothetical protein NC653_004768 [Populus alba x Populus x berolinensis]